MKDGEKDIPRVGAGKYGPQVWMGHEEFLVLDVPSTLGWKHDGVPL